MEHFYQEIGEDWFTYPLLYAEMVNRFPDGSRFVEVGAWRGRSASFMAVEIINSGKSIRLDCVDPWVLEYDDYDPGEYLFPREELKDPDWLYTDFLRNTEPVSHILRPVRLPSVDAARTYPDQSLEFVFIDACHEYESVCQDIRAWLPKTRSGGVLAGHDFIRGHWDGVCDAVEHTFSGMGQSGELMFQEHCWIYNKP